MASKLLLSLLLTGDISGVQIQSKQSAMSFMEA